MSSLAFDLPPLSISLDPQLRVEARDGSFMMWAVLAMLLLGKTIQQNRAATSRNGFYRTFKHLKRTFVAVNSGTSPARQAVRQADNASYFFWETVSTVDQHELPLPEGEFVYLYTIVEKYHEMWRLPLATMNRDPLDIAIEMQSEVASRLNYEVEVTKSVLLEIRDFFQSVDSLSSSALQETFIHSIATITCGHHQKARF